MSMRGSMWRRCLGDGVGSQEGKVGVNGVENGGLAGQTVDDGSEDELAISSDGEWVDKTSGRTKRRLEKAARQ